ncbi:GIY-YIG nuclease family protein [Aliivibrio sp. S4TY2]|uniref:GIY-YIG nuclease family protein n=1 Tax=Aliivibrio finisterrensis TaxID=511998 RepID=A0A4Q5KQS5_9GAMM|nr:MULTISPECIES: GIY-YIG nuclease family protein [Aliivibrio]KAB2824539.1 GIY-YIG nuclease family protein [Aliivibrio finisterrensis]MDD9157856.1 GIY-YIG nuclease family protein [Aliivibrio sp. S4TY2]MDD9161792.1 GIY-YIG nuclease family protein [Aliivibrio sp. S4TY1]MDD9165822.1 GIY-YIG nuclease family protein [Aliivibrio sp. S4MY2]MDD9169855.1 GIY-YIG nuclease family protein [Aliivibrio sp. S4MY4]
MTEIKSNWTLYLIRTQTNSLYCGITNNLSRRFEMHKAGKGAKYLRGKGPLTLVWSHNVESKSQALKYEYRIKKMTKASKEALVNNLVALPAID